MAWFCGLLWKVFKGVWGSIDNFRVLSSGLGFRVQGSGFRV